MIKLIKTINKITIKIINCRQKYLLLKNVFSTDFPKNVLIIYLINPFMEKIKYHHTNLYECYEIAKIFKELNYNVDVVNYNSRLNNLKYDKYHVLFGFGDPLCKSYYSKSKITTKKIYYGTGCHIEFQNTETLKRIVELYNKKKVYLPESGRIVDKAWSIQTSLVDSMIILGNQFTKNTYQKHFKKDILTINSSYLHVYDINLRNKNFNEARNNFLWFGGPGMIHKGLDILLDIFSKRKDIILHVCGPIKNEKRFEKLYFRELYQTENIKTYGFINLHSMQFIELMKLCAFNIFPSCSEGSSPSVITTMGNGGLIPIIPEACGIDIGHYGYHLKDLKESTISGVINRVVKEKKEDLFKKSKASMEYAKNHHSVNVYRNNIRKSIVKILG